MTSRKYNLKRERTIVPHDRHFHAAPNLKLPTIVDLRPKFLPVYDQGQLGSCTANAGCGAYRFDDKVYSPSRLFLYYNERALDGDIPDDAGSSLSQCVNALEKFGVCTEASWPYDITKFTNKPPQACYNTAKSHKVVQAHQVAQTLVGMKSCLASGLPFILGIEVFSGLESDQAATTGVVPMPSPGEQSIGGHAICCVGYDDTKGHWIMMNSWGSDWGANGFFYLPYAYLTNTTFTSDLWVLLQVTPEPKKSLKKTFLCHELNI